MKKIFIGALLFIFSLQACAPRTIPPTATSVAPPTAVVEPTVSETADPVEDTTAILERLGGAPCPESDFTCVTITVP